MTTEAQNTGSSIRRSGALGLLGILVVMFLGYFVGRWVVISFGTAPSSFLTFLALALGVLLVALFVFAATARRRLRHPANTADEAPWRMLRAIASVLGLASLFSGSVLFTLVLITLATSG